MRTVIEYTVTASTVAELQNKALEEYRKLVGDRDAQFPWDSELMITAETTGTDTRWNGQVTIRESKNATD